MLACRGTKWRHIEFEYPAAQKRYFDNSVTRTIFCTTSVPGRWLRDLAAPVLGAAFELRLRGA